MLGRRLGVTALQSLTRGASWQAYSTYDTASTIVVEAPADLRHLLPSDLKETLGIKQQCMYWYEPSASLPRWYIAWPAKAGDAAPPQEMSNILKGTNYRLGQARVHVAPIHPTDTLPVQRHTAFYRRHPPGHAVLVSNLPRLDDSEVRERVKQLFSGYSLRADAVFTDTRTQSALVGFTSPHEAAMAARQMHGTVLESQRLHMAWWDC